jgi:hypothetical protein
VLSIPTAREGTIADSLRAFDRVGNRLLKGPEHVLMGFVRQLHNVVPEDREVVAEAAISRHAWAAAALED